MKASELDGVLIKWYKKLTGWRKAIVAGIIGGIVMFIMDKLFMQMSELDKY